MKTKIKSLFLSVLLSFLVIVAFSQATVKITQPKLAIEINGQYLTGTAALPFVPQIDFPNSVPEPGFPTQWTFENVHPWHTYTPGGFLPNADWEAEYQNEMYFELEVQMPEWTEPHILVAIKISSYDIWDIYKPHLLKWRLYKHPDAPMPMDDPNYPIRKAAYENYLAAYLAAIQDVFVAVGTHKLSVDGRVKLLVLPIPQNHILYDQTWLGKVKGTCLQPTYDLKIRKLLGI